MIRLIVVHVVLVLALLAGFALMEGAYALAVLAGGVGVLAAIGGVLAELHKQGKNNEKSGNSSPVD